MAVNGRLATMPLGDLVRWLGESRKSGCLQIEKDRVTTSMFFREGRIVACSSDDPPKLLGQFLVFQGVIDDETLRQAMAEQERKPGVPLGAILVQSGAIDEATLSSAVASKAEETMLGLFEYEDGAFWYQDGLAPSRVAMRADVSAAELLAHGRKRQEDLQRFRATFPDLDVAPCPVGRGSVSDVVDGTTRQVYAAVDGERSIRKIMLAVHGTEFLVLRQLASLLHGGLIQIPGSTKPEPCRRAVEAPHEAPPIPWPPVEPVSDTAAPAAKVLDFDALDEVPQQATPPQASPATGTQPATSFAPQVDEARRLMERGRHEAALEILGEVYRLDPDNLTVRQLLAQAETTFLEDIERAGIPYSKIPVLVASREDASGGELTAAEHFLLDMIDGSWDVRSLTWIAPMRAVEVLRALNRLLERKMIRLEEPQCVGETAQP